MKLALPFVCLATVLVAQVPATYSLGPDSEPQAGVPTGTVTKHQLAPGKFYPGTPHNYTVYVPAQYNAAKPTAFMIFLDGTGAIGNLKAPVVFDNLIAKGELPPIIGIFVDPGVLPALSDQVQNRFERIFEYDSVTGRYARFLLEELVPEVGKAYNLSPSPDDHAIEGVSTGAVGAFVAAWHRPDQFHRVLSIIGTFVDMKGAEELPSLVRKTEPKPIRIFMQEGRNDHLVPGQPYGTFYAGSWPINNQVLYEAFQFAGYDVKFELGEGAHDTKQAAAILPDALRWLWAGYPKPVTVHEPVSMGQPGYDPRGRVYSIVSAAKPWEQIRGSYESVVSPTADKDGNVYFSDRTARRTYKVDPVGNVSLVAENSRVTALRCGPDGRLIAAEPDRKRIVSYGANGSETVLVKNIVADDLAVTAGGAVYFIAAGHRSVGFVDAAGKEHSGIPIGDNVATAGIALSPDQAMLVITDAHSRHAWSYQIGPSGDLVNGEPFYRLYVPDFAPGSGIGGVAFDALGQVYFATALGIQVTEQNGRVAAVLNGPEFGAVSNLTFGGKDLDSLYATDGKKLFRRPVKIKGVAPWNPIKPPRPPL